MVKDHGTDGTLPGLDLNPEQLFFLGFGQVTAFIIHHFFLALPTPLGT